MKIYVDQIAPTIPNRHWKHRHGCHLFTDVGPLDELHRFAESIGLKRSWFQDSWVPHYDLTSNKRDEAIRAGAVAMSARDAVSVWRQWRDANREDAKP